MITRLLIRNLILIEEVAIEFDKGLNILTGETGSGKSAILSALGLILGRRADSSLIRKGVDKAHVEAVFDIDRNPLLKSYLSKAGIIHHEGDELIISRELQSNGKGRTFINNQVVTASLLKNIGELLVGVVSQHANQSLCSLDYHRSSLDLYGDLTEKTRAFGEAWERVKKLQQELLELKEKEGEREREFHRIQEDVQEILEAKLVEGEDEELFAEYSRHIHVEEIANLCQGINQVLDEGVFQQLTDIKRQLEKLVTLDTTLNEAAKGFQSAYLELKECSYAIEKAASTNEVDPERLNGINERLTLIARLKKKYGKTLSEIVSYEERMSKRLLELSGADIKIEELETLLPLEQKRVDALAKELSAGRVRAAKEWEEKMTAELRQLNMPHALFSVALSPQKRGNFGDERVEFFLAPNVGENPVSVRECASGGEIARVMLAIQALLGGKEQTPTLLFDEIDANIGGETAVVVGEKLKEIATAHQVLCITHFQQVARVADNHFRIKKQEIGGRTLTLVDPLDLEGREEELQRMAGLTYAILK